FVCSFLVIICIFFFFQAEDGIRARNVTGVQTCALPISALAYSASYSHPGSIPASAAKIGNFALSSCIIGPICAVGYFSAMAWTKVPVAAAGEDCDVEIW